MYIISYIAASLIIRMGIIWIPMPYISTIEIALLIIMLLVMSNDRLSYRICVCAAILASLFISEVVALLVMRMMGLPISENGQVWFRTSPGVYTLVMAMEMMLLMVFLRTFEYVWNKAIRQCESVNLVLFSIFPISQGLLLWYNILTIVRTGGGQKYFLELSMLMVLSVVADELLLRYFGYVRTLDAEKQKAVFLEEQLHQQESYYERILHDASETAKVRHDMRNQLNTVYSLIAVGNNSEATSIIQELKDRIASPQFYCKNSVANVVMNEKAELCRAEGIKLDCSLSFDDHVGISGMDISSLLANVMDNAIHGCRESGAAVQQIRISAAVLKGYLVLTCRNTARQEPVKTADSPRSEHGWGLEILKDMAERHDGQTEITSESGIFEIRVFLKCTPEEETV